MAYLRVPNDAILLGPVRDFGRMDIPPMIIELFFGKIGPTLNEGNHV